MQCKYAETLLNDILHLSDDQILNSKIGLIMFWEGVSHLTRWYESDENNRHTDFTYYSHQAGLCKRLEVDSFDELEELVEIGKSHKTYN